MSIFGKLWGRVHGRLTGRRKMKLPKLHKEHPRRPPPVVERAVKPTPYPLGTKPMPPPPRKVEPPGELGGLSAIYESGKRGSTAIGWDRRGGASYGKYQIAYKVGSLKLFMHFIEREYPSIFDALDPLYPDAGNTKGAFATKWKQLARAGGLKDSEHAFIKSSHYAPCYARINAEAKKMVDGSWAIKQVLWSTAVQHGVKGGSTVFNYAAEVAGGNEVSFIKAVYVKRGRRLGKNTAAVQAAVRNRYKAEQKRALKMLAAEG